jgi:IclR family transcriptional regulator, acetate operon repressor
MADVQSLQRAFAVLRAVAAGSAAGAEIITLGEVARQVALPKSTVSRLLSTLNHVGAVERTVDPEGFRIGAELIALTAQVAYPRGLIAIARPYLQTLAQVTGETISLGIPEGDQAVTIDQIDSWRNLRLKSWVGGRLPLYCTSDGKLYLAHWPEATLADYLARPLERFSPSTLTNPSALRHELTQIRSQGYAWNNRERDPDIVSIAAPVYDESQQVIAAVCMFGPFFRFPLPEKRAEFIALTVKAANQIGARLKVLAQRGGSNGNLQKRQL